MSVEQIEQIETGPAGFTPEIDQIQQIEMSQILSDHTWNSRGKLTPADYHETQISISKVGLLQPITVQPWGDPAHPGIKYRIVMGHCRFAACKNLKWPTIKAIVKNFTPDEAFYANVMENLNRVQLNLKQESKLVSIMSKRGMTKEEIGKRLDKPSQWVTIRLKYSEAPEKLQNVLLEGQYSAKELHQILKLVTLPRQFALIRTIAVAREQAEKKLEESYEDLVESFNKKMSERRTRKPGEVTELKNAIYDLFGPSLVTRALAWADGSISSNDIWEDLEALGEKEGVVVKRPTDKRDAHIRSDLA